MGVSLYTSRIILNTLGVDNFGIYNIVGGVVILFSFLNSAMSGATSRFITYELGSGDIDRVSKVFSGALTIHIAISLVLLLFAETVGVWFLETQLNIPPDRMVAARVVYQFSIFSALIAITQVPYNASIIANERMNIYAYISIVEVGLKLAVAFSLAILPFDKLITYSMLMFAVVGLVAVAYRFYCIKYLSGCRYKFHTDRAVLKPMLSFTGWDMYGNMCIVGNTQGVNMLINIFFGVALNTAYGIAMQVGNAVSLFANNFLTAVRPNIIKNYASGDTQYVVSTYYQTSKFAYLLLLLFVLPLLFEMPTVLAIWLREVPASSVLFARFALVVCIISTLLISIPNILIHATGNVKKLSLVRGTIFLSTIPIAYVMLRYSESVVIPIAVNLVVTLIAGLYSIYLINSLYPQFSIRVYLRECILFVAVVTVVDITVLLLVNNLMDEGFVRVVVSSFASSVVIVGLTYYFGISSQIREGINSKLRQQFLKRS